MASGHTDVRAKLPIGPFSTQNYEQELDELAEQGRVSQEAADTAKETIHALLMRAGFSPWATPGRIAAITQYFSDGIRFQECNEIFDFKVLEYRTSARCFILVRRVDFARIRELKEF